MKYNFLLGGLELIALFLKIKTQNIFNIVLNFLNSSNKNQNSNASDLSEGLIIKWGYKLIKFIKKTTTRFILISSSFLV